ncbi:hypothetical protein [Pseudorhodoferax sp.]|uniref:hypothetical protein n=1 Tax=Pseudorhodoferax sp. TaxID=1993553 RepID=UPI002DD61932|nr:hypothetical protein [Pseudorhodoferax sp.]
MAASAIAGEPLALDRAAAAAGVPRSALVPDLRALTPGPPGRVAPPPWLRALQAEPLQAHTLARALRAGFAAEAGHPAAALARAAWLYTPDAAPSCGAAQQWAGAADPLAAVLQRLWQMDGQAAAMPALPDDVPAHRALRTAVASMLGAIVDAEAQRRHALAAVPAEVTPALLLAQLAGGPLAPHHDAMLREALGQLERAPLAAGMQCLAEAAERLVRVLPGLAPSARVAWQLDTPWGVLLVDTLGTDRRYELDDPLLVVDVGGDDRYVFAGRSARNRISVLLDLGGNDRYEARAPASDPSAGLLGYGILWDSSGDDHYRGGWFAQGAAVLGAALLVDEGGSDHYEAVAMAQGFAWGGLGLLLDRAGDDRYAAASHAQGSAGPAAVALLLDASGNDRYALGAEAIVVRSPQLPDRNTSMGQGAGRGLRATAQAPAVAGGFGLLLDLAGDDSYRADVFAQGAGYYLGVGLLVDAAGHDRFEAAWYAMGAAAHAAAGVLLKEGSGNDQYRVSHSTGLGAAHDGSLAYFRDEGGDDQYTLGNLGYGAAQDAAVALFVEAGGDDRYAGAGPPCHAFGLARHSPEGPVLPHGVGLGLFLDLGGHDHYPPHCKAGDGAAWSGGEGGAPADRATGPGVSAGVDMEAGRARD